MLKVSQKSLQSLVSPLSGLKNITDEPQGDTRADFKGFSRNQHGIKKAIYLSEIIRFNVLMNSSGAFDNGNRGLKLLFGEYEIVETVVESHPIQD